MSGGRVGVATVRERFGVLAAESARGVFIFGTAPVLVFGLGYGAAPAIRMEVLVEYRPRLASEGRANFLEPGLR